MFRKHQKVMLAVLGLLAMISFVILPILLDMLTTTRVRDPVAVSTSRYGDLHVSGVAQLKHNRFIVSKFLERVAAEVQRAGGNPMAAYQALRLIGAEGEEEVVATWLMANRAEELGFVVSDAAINQFLAGLTTSQGITSGQVVQILRGLNISDHQLFGLLRHELLAFRLQRVFHAGLGGATPGQRWNYYKRLNLKATLELMPVSVPDFTADLEPSDDSELTALFDQYKGRLKDPMSPEPGFRVPKKIALEYFRADYDVVANPETVPLNEVEAYYEERKDELYRRMELPEVEEQPRSDDSDNVTEPEGQEAPKVQTEPTAETKPDTDGATQPESPGQSKASVEPEGPSDSQTEESMEDAAPPTAEPAEEPKSVPDQRPPTAAQPAAEEAGSAKAETSEEPPTEKEAPDESASPESSPSPAGEPDTESKGENSDQGPAAEEPGPSAESEQTSSALYGSPFRLAGFQTEEKQETAAEEDSDEGADAGDTAADQGDPATPGSSQDSAGQTDQQPVGGESAEDATAAKPTAEDASAEDDSAEDASDEGETAEDASAEAETAEDASAEKEMESIVDSVAGEPKSEYLLLEEVEDQVRKTLAEKRAQEVLDALRYEMQRFQDDWIVYDALPEEDRGQPPARPDLEALAKKHGLKLHRTGLISVWQASKLDIAQSTINRRDFLNYAFGSLLPYKPEISQDLDGNYYVFWKLGKLDNLQETKERIPEYEEVRAQVLAAWQTAQAREEAAKEAEKLAQKAREGGKSLKDTFPDRKVVETEPFTWNTYGTVSFLWNPRPPDISEIKPKLPADSADESQQPDADESQPPDAVDSPGDEFMRGVFQPKTEDGGADDIKVGDIGVAMNQPQTTVYVYRVTDLSPSAEVLTRQFFLENYDRYRYVGLGEGTEAYRGWLDQLRASVDFKWEREPSTSRSG
jgi:hypothetical protein